MLPALLSKSMLRDAVIVAAIAVVTVQALRRWIGDRYLVPSGSMEPVLYGHPSDGDVVFVDKTARPASLRRHDLVVVRHPEEPGQQLVKRIAARGDDVEGGCWIDLRQGDVWLGPDPQRLQREQKDPLAARGQRVPWAAAPGSPASAGLLLLEAATPVAAGFRLPACVDSAEAARGLFSPAARAARRRDAGGRPLPAGCIGSARPFDAGFLDATGARGRTGADVAVTDGCMELDLVRVAGDVLATIETRGPALTFHWRPATGRVALWRDGVDIATAALPVRDRPTRLEFGLLDGRAFLCIDGSADASFVVPATAWRDDRDDDAPGGPRTLVHVGVAGGDGHELVFAALRLGHDVFAWREPIVGMPGQAGSWPRHVPPGHWFLLGDCAFDSRDSRQLGAVPTTACLGVPRAVLGPWPRCRWVRP